jgi:hypothetical protein
MQKLVTLNQNASPDNVLTFDTVTGEVQYSPKANIATPTTVTGTKPTGNTIGTINGTDIKETVTSFGTPIITGKTVTLPYSDETGTVKNVAIDLTTLLVDVKATAFVLDPITKIITITNSDGTQLTIDGTKLMNLTQLADVISIIGTGTASDPFRLNFATRAMLDTGTDTTHAVNVAELKNQIQTNQYKFGKAVTTIIPSSSPTTQPDTTLYNVTLDYPITTLKDGEQFVIIFDQDNTSSTNIPVDDGSGVGVLIDEYNPNLHLINLSGTGNKTIYKRVKTGVFSNTGGNNGVNPTHKIIDYGDLTGLVPLSITYSKSLDAFFLDDIALKPDFILPTMYTIYSDGGNGFVQTKIGTNSTESIKTNKLLLAETTMLETDNIVIGKGIGTNTTNRKILLGDFKKLLTPKKYYSASTPLIVGETTITHNLGLTAPFAFLSDFRDPITGASIGLRIKAGSKTANSYIVISTIATNVEITNM